MCFALKTILDPSLTIFYTAREKQLSTSPLTMNDSTSDTLPAITDTQATTPTIKTPTTIVKVLDAIKIDEDGDLEILVGAGETAQSFIVCAKTLGRHSQVFKRMLFGGFKESKPSESDGGDWVVELPDDEAKPFQILLDIVHGWFEQVPELLTLDELTALLVLMEKYDVTSLTRPWAAG